MVACPCTTTAYTGPPQAHMSSIHDIVLVGGSTKILPLEYTSGYGYDHTGDPNMDRMEFALPEPVKSSSSTSRK